MWRCRKWIEDYALFGDRHTAALVSREGSVDWLCFPRFDSDACAAALLGAPEHGRWLLTPREAARTTRRYLDGTMVLETTHDTDTGTVQVLDLMPPTDGRADVVRRVEGVSGTVTMEHEWIVRLATAGRCLGYATSRTPATTAATRRWSPSLVRTC